MNINTASPKQVTTFISDFIEEKELDKTDFVVNHPVFGETNMPFSIVQDGLTTTEQNISFLRQAALAISSLDFCNAPKEKFREFFQCVADEMIKF